MKTPSIHRRHPILFIVTCVLFAACGPATKSDPAVSEAGESRVTLQEENSSSDDLTTAPPEPFSPLETAGNQGVESRSTSAEFDADGIEVGFTEEGRPYRGNPSAAVVLEEFSDYQCPFCSRFFNQTLPGLKSDQIASGEVMLLFYDFPISSIHPQAVAAANAARCAGEQGAVAFWSMHDLMFSNPEQWSNSNAVQVFEGYAEQIELDMEAFTACQNANKYAGRIQADIELGQQRGVNSTPSFFINGQPLIGAQPLSTFNQAISAVQNGEVIASEPEPVAESEQAIKPTPASISLENVAARMGEPTAPVTIVEYTDYQCPFCQRHNAETMPQLVRNLVDSGRVQYVLKDFPLEQIHPEARMAAAAARCAAEQAAYWPMHDTLFAVQNEWSGQGANAVGVFAGLADDLDLDVEAFQACMDSGRHDDAIQANLDEGIGLGVRGTPSFFVNGFPVTGAQPYALFEYAVGLAEQNQLADAYVPRATPEAASQPQPSGPVEIPIADAFSIGDPDAPVTVVEYTDYQCPFCSRHFGQTLPQLKENYIDQGIVRYVFKDFPLTSIHPQAVLAAEAARCAGDQSAYLEMHDALFDRQGEWSNRGDAGVLFREYAENLGLDVDAFSDCLESHAFQGEVMADLDEGIGFGVRGTPAFFINGVFVSGAQPYSVFEQAINSVLDE